MATVDNGYVEHAQLCVKQLLNPTSKPPFNERPNLESGWKILIALSDFGRQTFRSLSLHFHIPMQFVNSLIPDATKLGMCFDLCIVLGLVSISSSFSCTHRKRDQPSNLFTAQLLSSQDEKDFQFPSPGWKVFEWNGAKKLRKNFNPLFHMSDKRQNRVAHVSWYRKSYIFTLFIVHFKKIALLLKWRVIFVRTGI